jgi:hypothetical protein
VNAAVSGALLAGLAALRITAPLDAQRPEDRGAFSTGGEVRVLSFDRLPALKRLRQIVIPFGAVVSRGPLTVDLGSAWASTELTRADQSRSSVEHLTDTQLRGAYTFGRDAVVATVLVNLPTGPRSASALDYSVIGAVSPTFLGYPIAGYASGFSVTGGLAGATQVGSNWSLGLAGSLRMSSEFTPYLDSTGPIVYKPGVEGRVRGGADGVVGRSRLTFGLTVSTFGDDQVGASGGAGRGQYRPGTRWIAEAGLLAPVGNGMLSLSAWNYHRASGDTAGASIGNRENLTGADLAVSIPAGRDLAIEPLLAGRLSKPEAGNGRMIGVGGRLRIRLSETVALTPLARYDTGSIDDGSGQRSDLHGWYLSALLRLSF